MSSESSVATTVSARALASRINGARSRGPRTAAGKARSSRNALKHGLCAHKLAVLPDEDAAALAAFEAALVAELAPEGALQAVLAERVVSAAWRLARADRLETEVLAFRRGLDGDLGLALIRDGNGTRAVETVLRYRGAALAEFLRALRTLQALQAEARAGADLPAASPARRRARPRPQELHARALEPRPEPRARVRIASRAGSAPPRRRSGAAPGGRCDREGQSSEPARSTSCPAAGPARRPKPRPRGHSAGAQLAACHDGTNPRNHAASTCCPPATGRVMQAIAPGRIATRRHRERRRPRSRPGRVSSCPGEAEECQQRRAETPAHLVTRPLAPPLIRRVTSPSTRGRAKPPGAAR